MRAHTQASSAAKERVKSTPPAVLCCGTGAVVCAGLAGVAVAAPTAAPVGLLGAAGTGGWAAGAWVLGCVLLVVGGALCSKGQVRNRLRLCSGLCVCSTISLWMMIPHLLWTRFPRSAWMLRVSQASAPQLTGGWCVIVC